MTSTIQLHNAIDALIAADALPQVHNSKSQILENLTDAELAYVMALALFGRADRDADEGTTPQRSLDDALEHVKTSGLDRAIAYVRGKPLSRYARGTEARRTCLSTVTLRRQLQSNRFM